MATHITPESLVAQLTETPWEEQGAVLRAALAAQWQPQLAAHLDYWARVGLARLRAIRRQGQHNPWVATAALYTATVWIAPVWPSDAPAPAAVSTAAALTPQETVFRLPLATNWEVQLTARLDYWTSDTLSKVRAAPDLVVAATALAPLLMAQVAIDVEWPDV